MVLGHPIRSKLGHSGSGKSTDSTLAFEVHENNLANWKETGRVQRLSSEIPAPTGALKEDISTALAAAAFNNLFMIAGHNIYSAEPGLLATRK